VTQVQDVYMCACVRACVILGKYISIYSMQETEERNTECWTVFMSKATFFSRTFSHISWTSSMDWI